MAYPQQVHRLPSPNLSHRSHRSEHSQSRQSLRSHASMRSTTNGVPITTDSRALEASHIIDQLKKEIVFLTGGRDRQGGPLLLFPPHRDKYFLPNDIAVCVRYLAQIPSDESKRRGFTVIVDSRDGSWSNLVTLLGCLKQSLGDYLKQVLVLQTENTGSRQSSSSSFRRDRGVNIEPQFINLNKLYTYVDRNQLIGSMGGSLMYHHTYWLQNRLDFEKFHREARAAASHLDTVESEISHQVRGQGPESLISPVNALKQHRFFQETSLGIPRQVLGQGEDLLGKLQRYSDVPLHGEEAVITLDNLEAMKQVKRTLQYLGSRLEKIGAYLENKDQSLHHDVQRDSVQKEIRQVVEWILGPGEKLLASHHDIGDSYETAEVLRKRHEELEIKCTDTYGHYAELRHRAEDLLVEQNTSTVDIRSQRDYMDTVCRSFANRLERRRTLLITSVRFHRLTEEFSRKLDDLLESLYIDTEIETVEAAKEALAQLQDKIDAIDSAASRAMEDGHTLLDEMSRPVKNAFGKDISPDYATHLKHVNQRLEDLQERKMRCDELAEVRRLKLQQTLQLRSCERDAKTAITWLFELCEVMMTSHTHIGQSQQEIDQLQGEHRQVEATALSTYEYGKQLVQAALVLRRSLRMDLEPNHQLSYQLEEAWKRFSGGNNERANRLTVASMFLSESDKLLERIEQLMVVIAQTLTGDVAVRDALHMYSPERADVSQEVQETGRMGRALLERLALPIIVVDGREKRLSTEDQSATEAINGRLRKMDHKLSELNRYWQEMQQTGQPPSVTPKFSMSNPPYLLDQGQRLQQPQRSMSQRGSRPSSTAALNTSLPASRTQSFNKAQQPKGRKRPIAKHGSIRSTIELERQLKEAKVRGQGHGTGTDRPDAMMQNGHSRQSSINENQIQPAMVNGSQSQPHVSQSYYPHAEDITLNIPPSKYTYQPKSHSEEIPVPEEQVQPKVHSVVQSQYQPRSSHTYLGQSQPDLSRARSRSPQPEVSKVSSSSSKSQPDVSRMGHSVPEQDSKAQYQTRNSAVPDTLPITKSMPDVNRSSVPPKVDILPKVYISRRTDDPPMNFQHLLTKFQTSEVERPKESREKKEVQAELSQVLKSRAGYLEPEEIDEQPKKRRPAADGSLYAQMEEVSLCTIIP